MTQYHVIVAHSSDESILVHDDKRLSLPVLDFDGCIDTDLEELSQLLVEKIDASFRVIRLRTECEVPIYAGFWWGLLMFEITDTDTPETPRAYKWIRRDQCSKAGVEPRIEKVVEYLAACEREGLDVKVDRLRPYSRAGWFGRACEWTRNELGEQRGYEVDDISQLRSGEPSCVLRAMTKTGCRFFMKATRSGAWNKEVVVTRALGEVMPCHFEKPIACDEDEGWMLMRDHGDTMPWSACDYSQSPDRFKEVLLRWAEIQKESVPLCDVLTKAGVPVMDCAHLKEQLKKIVSDQDWFRCQMEGIRDLRELRPEDDLLKVYEGYSIEEYGAEYMDFIDRLDALLGTYMVPLSLVHGDLNSVNIIAGENEQYKFIDFANTEISHPFIDANRFAHAEGCGREDADVEFYLREWECYEPLDRLRELYDLIGELNRIESTLSDYLTFSSDEGDRKGSEEELRFAVCRTFKLYKDK